MGKPREPEKEKEKEKKCPCGTVCLPKPDGKDVIWVCPNHGIVYRKPRIG